MDRPDETWTELAVVPWVNAMLLATGASTNSDRHRSIWASAVSQHEMIGRGKHRRIVRCLPAVSTGSFIGASFVRVASLQVIERQCAWLRGAMRKGP